jgi:hypothetical protein
MATDPAGPNLPKMKPFSPWAVSVAVGAAHGAVSRTFGCQQQSRARGASPPPTVTRTVLSTQLKRWMAFAGFGLLARASLVGVEMCKVGNLEIGFGIWLFVCC